MIRRTSMAVALLAAAPFATVQATDLPSSSHWDLAYLNSTVDFGGPMEDEVEGFRGAFSLGVAPFLSFVTDYEQRRYASSRDSFGSIGLEAHTTLGGAWQPFGAVTYERNDFDDKLGSALDRTEEGVGITVGGRAFIPNMEFHAQYKHLLLSPPAPETDLTGSRYGGGFVLDLTPWWSMTADYSVRTHEFEPAGGTSFEHEYQEWTVGLRRYFATQTDRYRRTGGILSALFGGGDAEDEAAAE